MLVTALNDSTFSSCVQRFCLVLLYATFNSSVTFSFFTLSLSTAFSSHRRAFAFRSLAPPEITPDFWKRVSSKATVCKSERQNRRWIVCYLLICALHSTYMAYLNLMPVWSSKGDPVSILHILTHWSIAAGILKGFLYVWRLLADNTDH